MHCARALLLAGAASLALAACGSTGSPPTWRQSPPIAGGGAQASPIIPVPAATGGGSGGGGGPTGTAGPGSTPSSGPIRHIDPNVVATHLSSPVGLTMRLSPTWSLPPPLPTRLTPTT